MLRQNLLVVFFALELPAIVEIAVFAAAADGMFRASWARADVDTCVSSTLAR